jgi:enoyl-[acyl-carrier protein] reductase II
MIKTKLCDLLDITYPILQGGMAWVADASLAAAVSNGGGLGIIGAMNANSEWLEEQVAKLRSLTCKPFGVNVMLLSPFADEIARAVVHLGVPVVTTGAGTPLKYMKDWLDAGIKVLPVVPSVAVAKLVAKRGATAVIAEGGESGGHVGDLTTLVLTPPNLRCRLHSCVGSGRYSGRARHGRSPDARCGWCTNGYALPGG